MGPTTLASWVALIARTLDERGIDSERLLRSASLDPQLMRNPDARYDTIAVQRLWAAALQSTQDPGFGLAVGRKWHPTTFHALGYAAMASSTLGEGLALVVRYSRVVTNASYLELQYRGNEVSLRLISRIPPHTVSEHAARAAISAVLTAIVVLCHRTRGSRPGLRRVTFEQTHPECISRMQGFFGCPVAAGRENSLVFSRSEVDTPLPTGNALLRRINEQIMLQYLSRCEAGSFTDRVSSELAYLMPSGRLTQRTIAKSLNVSVRSMQRKLQEERTTFRELLDLARKRHIDLYTHEGTLSRSEVAHLLGFSDERSLVRARNRWRAE
jgi:AraC-like DNA-binding protein